MVWLLCMVTVGNVESIANILPWCNWIKLFTFWECENKEKHVPFCEMPMKTNKKKSIYIHTSINILKVFSVVYVKEK